MTIIDAHCHIFPIKIARKATDAIGDFYGLAMQCQTGETQRLLYQSRRAGISRCVVCSTATVPHQVQSINNFVAATCEDEPSFIGLATLHPDFEGNFFEELQRAKDMGLKGVKLHPDFQRFCIDDAKALPMYEAAQALSLPILFHTGDKRYPYSQPARLAKVARLFPRLTVIGAHFGGYSVWDEVDAYAGAGDNVLFDTSSSLYFLDRHEAVGLIRRFGAERFLFGTDFPMWDAVEERTRFLALPLTDKERDQILHRTAERVYQL